MWMGTSNPFADRVINRAGDRGLDACRAQHADAFDAARQVLIRFVDHRAAGDKSVRSC
jgi:hypothetical protein